jgi:ABC-type multidrug transport system fused ATPase/permease subunit
MINIFKIIFSFIINNTKILFIFIKNPYIWLWSRFSNFRMFVILWRTLKEKHKIFIIIRLFISLYKYAGVLNILMAFFIFIFISDLSFNIYYTIEILIQLYKKLFNNFHDWYQNLLKLIINFLNKFIDKNIETSLNQPKNKNEAIDNNIYISSPNENDKTSYNYKKIIIFILLTGIVTTATIYYYPEISNWICNNGLKFMDWWNGKKPSGGGNNITPNLSPDIELRDLRTNNSPSSSSSSSVSSSTSEETVKFISCGNIEDVNNRNIFSDINNQEKLKSIVRGKTPNPSIGTIIRLLIKGKPEQD